MRWLPVTFIVFLVLTGCKKSNELGGEREADDNPVQSEWKAHGFFLGDNVNQMNSMPTSDKLFFIGSNGLVAMEPVAEENGLEPFDAHIVRYAKDFDQPEKARLPLSPDFFIGYHKASHTIAFTSNLSPLLPYGKVYFSMKRLDPDFSEFAFIDPINGESMAINSANQVLVPFLATAEGKSVLRLALIDVQVTKMDSQSAIDTLQTRIISLDDDAGINLERIQSVEEDFFVSTAKNFYKIDKAGAVSQVLPKPIYSVLGLESVIYGMGEGTMFASTDKGVTWTELYEVPSDLYRSTLTRVDGKTIGYRNERLWEVSLSQSGMSARELDNQHLQNHTITSINEFEGYVFLTTTSGVFFKDPKGVLQDIR